MNTRSRFAAAALCAVLTAVPLAGPTGAADVGRDDLPGTYVVSTDPAVLPEGIAVTPAGRIYVTSSTTGDVFTGEVGSPTMRPLVTGVSQGRASALGVHSDDRGRVFVASVSGVDVLDAEGTLLARRSVPAEQRASAYLNDLVITYDAVYVTDSASATVWRASLQGNEIGELEPWLDTHELMPQFQRGWFYLNGIASSPDARRLLVSAQGLGALIRVDVATRDQAFVLTDGSPFGNFGPDGMLLDVDTVRGVLNYGAPESGQGLYVARLSADWSTARVLAHDAGSQFSTPTTVARSGDRYLVVNSQLDTAPGTPPWTVVAAPDPLG